MWSAISFPATYQSAGRRVRKRYSTRGRKQLTGNKSIIGVVERCEVGHFGRTAVGVLAMSEELVDGVESV